MFERAKVQIDNVDALAASNAYTTQFYFPRASRIHRYFVIGEVAEAAHATQVLSVTFTNKGTAGAGTDVLALITNDSDDSDDDTTLVKAYAAHVANVLETEDRPGTPANADNQADEIAAGSVIEVEVDKAAGTSTGAVTVGIEYVESD